jgi:hypothetical protein
MKYTIVSLVIVLIIVGAAFYYFSAREAVAPGEVIDVPLKTVEEEGTQEKEDFGEPEEFTAEMTKLEAVGGYTGDGIATREYDGLSFIHTITARLDDPAEDKFYEGWLVEGSDFFSTGKLEKAGGGYALTYTNVDDKSDYNEVVVTLETLAQGLDNNPEAHVLEGVFTN